MPMETPYKVLISTAKDQIEKDRHAAEYFVDFSEKFIIWLIGFSVAGISLIIGNYDKVFLKFANNTKVIVLFLCLTIILGIVFRILAFGYLNKVRRVENYLYGVFSEGDMMPIIAEDLESKNINELIKDINDEFGEKINLPAQLTDEEKVKHLQKLREHYKELCGFSRKTFDLAVDLISDAYYLAYRTPKEASIEVLKAAFGVGNATIENKIKKRIGFNAKSAGKTVNILFYCSLISFIICIIWVGVIFLFINK